MPLCNVSYFSQSLAKSVDMNVILPDPGIKGPYATLYQLHGLSDDYSIWLRRTSIERYVARLPLVVAMPDGGRTWYTDGVAAPAGESHIMKDTIGFVEKFFPVRKSRDYRAIGGLSMGGYGALKLGLKYPRLFGSVAAHSSALSRGRWRDARAPELERIFGDAPTGGENDVFALAERLDPAAAPAIWFDCGTEDDLLPGNREFRSHLRLLGIKHTYREYPGDHDWGYWDAHIQDALKFHLKHLAI